MTAPVNLKFFDQGKQMTASDVVAKLRGEGGAKAAQDLLHDAREIGFGVDALLQQYVEPTQTLNGFEATFQTMGVPLRVNDETASAALAASTNTFMTNQGLQVFLPSLINSLVRAQQLPQIERVEDIVSQTRFVRGNVLQREIEYDKARSDSYATFRVAEGAEIPKRTLKGTQTNVRFYKTGHAIEVSYETAESMTPDMLVPFANRIAFERGQSEHGAAVKTLINGQSSVPNSPYGAATVDELQTFDGKATGKLRTRAEGFIKWLVQAAREGRPIDTVVVGWSTLFELQFMFPVTDQFGNAAVGTAGIAQQLNPSVALTVGLVGGLALRVTVVVSSQMEDNQLLGYRRAETLERLIKANSQISEQERSISNQTLLFTNTTISGFNLAYGESRRVLSWTD